MVHSVDFRPKPFVLIAAGVPGAVYLPSLTTTRVREPGGAEMRTVEERGFRVTKLRERVEFKLELAGIKPAAASHDSEG